MFSLAEAHLKKVQQQQPIRASSFTTFVIYGQASDFFAEAVVGPDETNVAVPGNTREESRFFASLKAVAMALKRLGIDRLNIDTAQAPSRMCTIGSTRKYGRNGAGGTAQRRR